MGCPRRTPWTACVDFPDSYPIDVSHLSFNFFCLLLLYSIYLNGQYPLSPSMGKKYPERRHRSTRVTGLAFLALRSSWRLVLYIYYITSAGNSINSQLLSATGPVRDRQALRPVHHVKNHTGRVTLLQLPPGGPPCWASLYSLQPQWKYLPSSLFIFHFSYSLYDDTPWAGGPSMWCKVSIPPPLTPPPCLAEPFSAAWRKVKFGN